MRPYSLDIRERIIQAYLNGEGSQRVIARRFRVSLSFVRDLLNRFRRTGTLAPAPRRAFSTSKLDAESLALLLQLAANNPELSLSVLCRILSFKRNVSVSRSTVWRAIKRNEQVLATSNRQDVALMTNDRPDQTIKRQPIKRSGLAGAVAHESETRSMPIRA